MKKYWSYSFAALTLALLLSSNLIAQSDSTGLAGDHFSLEGALALFQKAASPEAFEKSLNSENNYINNLDLNEDGEVDYIRVIDHMEGEVHAIVLQVPVNEREAQDIAVIEIEKTGSQNATLQIIGDADVYGEEIIAEPFEEKIESSGRGPSMQRSTYRVTVNVWLWPSVRHVYRPGYRSWVSPWRWNAYPRTWKPWRARSWRTCHVHRNQYRPYFRVTSTHRVARAHQVYQPRRTSSRVVKTRTTTRVAGRNGKVTRTTTRTVTRQNKKQKVAKVKTPRGKVKKKGKQKTAKKRRGRG